MLESWGGPDHVNPCALIQNPCACLDTLMLNLHIFIYIFTYENTEKPLQELYNGHALELMYH